MNKIHIVLHTHWDREWYFTTSDSLVLMQRTFKNIINELNSNPDISFCLDGQYSVIEEFLLIEPLLEENVKKLVLESRLFIGPWYTQTDTQLINGESMVKNLYYGMYCTKKRFGKVMEVGYLPDTFGFCNQMPEIFKLANIDNFIFWRGSEFKDSQFTPYFMWESLGLNSVKAINLVNGYGMVKSLNCTDVFIEKTFNSILNKYENLGIDTEILMPVGNDQFEILEKSTKIVNEIAEKTKKELIITDYKTAIDSIFKKDFPKFQKEFRATEHTRIHKSIGSVRYEIKQSNYIAEQYLINRVEPLVMIANSLGIDIDAKIVYQAWKLLFEGQAHDSICGCISDEVYLDIINRNKRSLEIAKSIENIILKQLSLNLNLTSNQILIVNPKHEKLGTVIVEIFSTTENINIIGYNFEILKVKKVKGIENALVETVEGNYYENLDDYYILTAEIKILINPMGYKVIEFTNSSNEKIDALIERNFIGNSFERISFENGKFSYINGDVVIKDFISVIDCANDGDTYDFSPLQGDIEIVANFSNIISENTTKTHMEILGSILLPRSLDDRVNKTNIVDNSFVLFIDYVDGLFKIKLNFYNKVYSHKLVVGIKTNTKSDYSIASTAYGYEKRRILHGKVETDWEEQNVEIPIDIETFDGIIKLDTNEESFTLFSTFGKEYQVIGDTIYLTVLATTSQLGKPNLLYRPGRASGDVTKKGHVMIPTPLAQSMYEVDFEFGIKYTNDDIFTDYKNLNKFRSDTIFYQNQEFNKFFNRIDNKIMPFGTVLKLKNEYSLFELDTNAIITNIALDLENNYVVRGFSNENHDLKIKSDIIKGYKYTDLFGRQVNPPKNKFELFNITLEVK